MRFIILLKPLNQPLKYFYCHLTASNLPKVTQLVSGEFGFAFSHYITELIATSQFPFSKLYCASIPFNSSNTY